MKMQHLRRRFLHSTTAKTSMGTIFLVIIILAGFAVVTGIIKIPNIDLSKWGLGITGTKTSDLVDVNRKVQFTLMDEKAGAPLTSKALLVYNAQGANVESLTTDSAGQCHTGFVYASGTQIYVKYVSGNSKQWFSVVVPQLHSAEIQSSTYNDVALNSFTVGTGTIALTAMGASITTEYNGTTSGMTPVFKLELSNTGADNTGMKESSDPVLGVNYQLWMVVSLSGTGYNNIVYSGFATSWTSATTVYGANPLSADQFTKWKVGNNYQAGFQGDQTTTFSLDLSGYSTGSSGVTMDIYVYAYCDPYYAQTHGNNLGTAKYQLATLAITLKN